jgi:hypothetical protein
MVGTSTTHVRLIMIIKIHFARNRHHFSTANIPCSNQKGWTTTTSNVVRKAPKITQLERKRKITQGTSALIYRPARSVATKKHGRSFPVGFHPRPQWSLVVPTPVISWLLLPVGLNSNSAISGFWRISYIIYIKPPYHFGFPCRRNWSLINLVRIIGGVVHNNYTRFV